MIYITDNPIKEISFFNNKYKILTDDVYFIQHKEEILDEFVKKHSMFKTFNEYMNAWNSLKKIDFDTLINIAPSFGRLYNEKEFIRLLNKYLEK